MVHKCKICDREFDSGQKLGGHTTVHKRIAKVKKVKLVKEHKCQYCGKEYDKGQSLGSHTRMCKLNPKYEKRKEIGISNRKLWNDNKEWKVALNEKISVTVKEKILNGTWHYSFSKVRTYEYKGVRLYGKWELQYAKWLDENNINWRRPREKFAYVFENKERYYTPDFYLVDTNEYVEIKGYETDKDRAKWKDFPFKLIIIKGKELKEKGIINEKQLKGLE